MKSEFTLYQYGFTWALYNYRGELVYASCNPRAAIREGCRIIQKRLYNFAYSRDML